MSGKDFPLQDDSKILAINSPRDSVGGPYAVVYKNMEERWAIVAMDWDGEPRLGMRWFWGGGGNPLSSGYPIWLVIPPSLSKNILSGLPIGHKFGARVDDFLAGKIDGATLKEPSKDVKKLY